MAFLRIVTIISEFISIFVSRMVIFNSIIFMFAKSLISCALAKCKKKKYIKRQNL